MNAQWQCKRCHGWFSGIGIGGCESQDVRCKPCYEFERAGMRCLTVDEEKAHVAALADSPEVKAFAEKLASEQRDIPPELRDAADKAVREQLADSPIQALGATPVIMSCRERGCSSVALVGLDGYCANHRKARDSGADKRFNDQIKEALGRTAQCHRCLGWMPRKDILVGEGPHGCDLCTKCYARDHGGTFGDACATCVGVFAADELRIYFEGDPDAYCANCAPARSRTQRVMTKRDSKAVNHPAHYNRGIETIDYIESHGLDFNEGNVVKYVTRWRMKGGVQDLQKARFYLDRLIEQADRTAAEKATGG